MNLQLTCPLTSWQIQSLWFWYVHCDPEGGFLVLSPYTLYVSHEDSLKPTQFHKNKSLLCWSWSGHGFWDMRTVLTRVHTPVTCIKIVHHDTPIACKTWRKKNTRKISILSNNIRKSKITFQVKKNKNKKIDIYVTLCFFGHFRISPAYRKFSKLSKAFDTPI